MPNFIIRMLVTIMIRFFISSTLILLSLSGIVSVHARSIKIPSAVELFVDAGSSVLNYQVTDLNGDRRKDAVVVFEKPATDLNRGMQRTLLVLLRTKTGQFKSVARNEHIIACSKCSDFAEDPFEARRLSVKNGQLTITQYFDIGFHPSLSIYSFKYQPKSQEFKTTMAKQVRYEQLDSGKFKRSITQHISDYGATLNTFDPKWQPPEQK